MDILLAGRDVLLSVLYEYIFYDSSLVHVLPNCAAECQFEAGTTATNV